VLDIFQKHRRDLGVLEIAEELGLSPATSHRILRALVDGGYLAQNITTERYYLSRSAVLLGEAASERLGLDRAQSSLDQIRDETGESINLGTRDGNEVVVVLRSESRHPLRFSQQPGSRLPVHATSMGKAMLAYASPDPSVTVASLEKPLLKLTPHTITAQTKLLAELKLIRARGYSIDNEEAIAGVRCVGAAILSEGGHGHPYAAVAIQAPAVRMPQKRVTQLASIITELALELSEHLAPSYPL
jgi:IclR family acetate operon transcriptional repressor